MVRTLEAGKQVDNWAQLILAAPRSLIHKLANTEEQREVHSGAPKRFWTLGLPNRMKLSLKTGKVIENLSKQRDLQITLTNHSSQHPCSYGLAHRGRFTFEGSQSGGLWTSGYQVPLEEGVSYRKWVGGEMKVNIWNFYPSNPVPTLSSQNCDHHCVPSR